MKLTMIKLLIVLLSLVQVSFAEEITIKQKKVVDKPLYAPLDNKSKKTQIRATSFVQMGIGIVGVGLSAKSKVEILKIPAKYRKLMRWGGILLIANGVLSNYIAETDRDPGIFPLGAATKYQILKFFDPAIENSSTNDNYEKIIIEGPLPESHDKIYKDKEGRDKSSKQPTGDPNFILIDGTPIQATKI